MRPSSRALLTLLVVAPGCWGELASSALSEVNPIDDTSTTGDDSAGSTWSGPISTVTTATTSSGGESEAGTDATATAGDTDGSTSGDAPPVTPPAITDHSLSPDPINFAGPIAVTIWADDAEGVWMDAGGVVVELSEAEPGVFEGEIAVLSGFDNGDHEAVFTPWRDDEGAHVEGEPQAVPYGVELPSPGGEALWDVDYASGSGQVTAMGVLSGGSVVELVTLLKNGVSGCYLRKRDEQGVSGPDDVVELLPDHCKGIDLEVGEDGIYFLIDGETNAGWMWWAAKMAYFGAPPKSIAYGGKDEVARALAVSPSGTVAVCGSAPTPQPGDLTDAKVWIVEQGVATSKAFDYQKNGWSHTFDEEVRGCAFLDEDRVVLVGSAFGKHVDWQPPANRRFDSVFDIQTQLGDLRVRDVGLATQSAANDVIVDPDEGRSWIVGYTSNDVSYEGQLWVLDESGDPGPAVSLGVHSSEALGPNTVRWSPAAGGSIVIASGGLIGSEPAFTVRAYSPLKAEPLWSFVRQDAGLVHVAHALAIGPYGQIYAGGFGANGYPLFVIIYG